MTPEQIEQFINFINSVYNAKTTSEQINLIVTFIKKVLLNHLQTMVESKLWFDFNASFHANKKIYINYEYDLPIVRDLKAVLNMLSAVEKATQKLNSPTKDPIMGLLLKGEILNDVLNFHQNYQIFNSTNNILTHYYHYAKKFMITTLIPKALHKLQELSQYCTHENLEKAENLFIEQLLSLERYRENYLNRKNLTQIKEIETEKKENKEDDFVTFLVKKNDNLVKKLYPELSFPRENKTESDEIDNMLDYYETGPNDPDTIKNIKLLLNGVIGIKKVLNDHEEYQQAGFFQSVGWMTTFIKDLRRAYQSLVQFDYQAIIAEQSNPFVEEMKKQLKKLNIVLEKLACIADQLEGELHLKDGYLLAHVESLLECYNQITYELRIPIDYHRQKNLYSAARLQHNENYLIEVDQQLLKLKDFMRFKHTPLADIPFEIIIALKNYIEQYEDDICMDHERLEIYKNYLQDTLNIKRGFQTFFLSQFEYAANQFGLTIHDELMKTLHSRMRYLENQQVYLENRFETEVAYYKQNPYFYFKSTATNTAVLPALKKHIASLTHEKNLLNEECEKELLNKKIKLEDISPRLMNKMTLKGKEWSFFQSVLKNYEEKKTLEPLEEKNNLPPKSVVLLKEMGQLLSVSKC
jgi:hypothetical protein